MFPLVFCLTTTSLTLPPALPWLVYPLSIISFVDCSFFGRTAVITTGDGTCFSYSNSSWNSGDWLRAFWGLCAWPFVAGGLFFSLPILRICRTIKTAEMALITMAPNTIAIMIGKLNDPLAGFDSSVGEVFWLSFPATRNLTIFQFSFSTGL